MAFACKRLGAVVDVGPDGRTLDVEGFGLVWIAIEWMGVGMKGVGSSQAQSVSRVSSICGEVSLTGGHCDMWSTHRVGLREGDWDVRMNWG